MKRILVFLTFIICQPMLFGQANNLESTINDYAKNNNFNKVVERFGSIQGANTLLAHFLTENISIVIFSNTNAADLSKFKNEIANFF